MNPKNRIKAHIQENIIQYLLVVIILLAGIVLGNSKVTGLDGEVRIHLLELVDNYVQGNTGEQSLLWGAFLNQARIVVGVWFLGLTVIGLPLILAVIFYRGFSLGFTVGFLVSEKAGAGWLLSIVSILPQNLVYVPFLAIWSVIAMNFTVYIVKGRKSSLVPLTTAVIRYSMLMLFFLLLFLAGAFVEAYLSPWLLSLII